MWSPRPAPTNLIDAICYIDLEPVVLKHTSGWWSGFREHGAACSTVGQRRSGEAQIMLDDCSLTASMTEVNSSDSLSEPTLVQWDQGSSWFMTSYDWNKQAVPGGMKELIPLNGPHVSPQLNPIEDLWDMMFQSRSSLMLWSRAMRRSPRTPPIVSLGASDMRETSRLHPFSFFHFPFGGN